MRGTTIPGKRGNTCDAAKNYKKYILLREKFSSVLISLHHEVTTRFNCWRVVGCGMCDYPTRYRSQWQVAW